MLRAGDGYSCGVGHLPSEIGSGWLVGLKAAAVAVVAHAVFGMAKTLTPDARRATIAVGALTLVLLIPGVLAQVAAIIAAAIAGWAWLRPSIAPAQGADAFSARVPRTVAIGSLIVFALLLAILPILATVTGNGAVGLVDVFYRAGSLVFGGGHVVLPLLEAETVQTGLVGHDAFLAGYGAAQAVPGPADNSRQ